ncbi:hypothetical protein MMC07_002300 [Pseudocyphellaria aurata]|nr:hypothetical protein [Pseudocyphellaria aurata]
MYPYDPRKEAKGKTPVSSAPSSVIEPSQTPATPSTRDAPSLEIESGLTSPSTKPGSVGAKAALKKWGNDEFEADGLPLKGTALTDQEVYVVVTNSMPTHERAHYYPNDFVIKGFPRIEREHRDPPAFCVDIETGKMYYAVVCDAYQLHGQEGQLAGLEHKKGKRLDRSVAAEPRMGDAHIHGATFQSMSRAARAGAAAAPKTDARTSKTAPQPTMSGGLTPRSPRRAYEAEDLPTGDSTSDEAPSPSPRTTDPIREGLRVFGQRMEEQLGKLMEHMKKTSEAAAKMGVKPNVAARRYNETKGAWKRVRDKAGEEVERELDRE